MGYYIQVPDNKGKAQQIVKLYGGRVVSSSPTVGDITSDEAIICVVDNGLFEAAGFCHDQKELAHFTRWDGRPKTWVIMNYTKACKLTGYNVYGD